ncbi:MAG: hypothetical protein NWE89_16060 [Candidatus Bathyarchaeota archaeon]|nr:hypothetical protein [Candidatus Bathyarchaeota archaeon]
MVESGVPKYHCQKCDAPIDPTDKICPNGHVLKEVGKKIKLHLEDRINLFSSFEIKLSKEEENFLKRMSNRIKKALEKSGIDAITINLGIINITFDRRSQDTK